MESPQTQVCGLREEGWRESSCTSGDASNSLTATSAALLNQANRPLPCHGIRGPVDVDATVTAQTQVIADILRADVGYAAVAADVELGAGKVERASDAGGAAGSLDVAGHVRGPVLEEGQS